MRRADPEGTGRRAWNPEGFGRFCISFGGKCSDDIFTRAVLNASRFWGNLPLVMPAASTLAHKRLRTRRQHPKGWTSACAGVTVLFSALQEFPPTCIRNCFGKRPFFCGQDVIYYNCEGCWMTGLGRQQGHWDALSTVHAMGPARRGRFCRWAVVF